MRKARVLILIWLLICATLSAAANQPVEESAYSIEDVFSSIERNNPTLKVEAALRDAQSFEAKMGNSLDAPELEYVHGWNKPSDLGKRGEFTVKQEFDFPTVYAKRNRVAKLMGESYGEEYMFKRQQLLLEVQFVCAEIIAARNDLEFMEGMLESSYSLKKTMKMKLLYGSASVIDEKVFEFEYIKLKKYYRDTENRLQEAESELATLNGGVKLVVVGDWLSDYEVLLPDIDELMELYNESSYVRLLELQKEVATEGVKLSRNMHIPKLSVGYMHERGKGERFNGFIVGMSIPIFSNNYSVKRAKAQKIVAETTAYRAELELRSSLDALYVREKMLKVSRDEYRELLKDVNTREHIQKAFDTGQIPLLDYIAQIDMLLNAAIELSEIERDYYKTCAEIMMLSL